MLFRSEQIEKIRNFVGDGSVLTGVSGGVDSTVVAALLHKAVGIQSLPNSLQCDQMNK